MTRLEELRPKLLSLADEKYKIFAQSLIPANANMIGVRLPELRKIARALARDCSPIEAAGWLEACEFFEEKMLALMAAAYAAAPLDERLAAIKAALPHIDNWSLCDSFCATLKFPESDLPKLWKFILPLFGAEGEFACRFAHVAALEFFVSEKYLEKYLRAARNFRNPRFYAMTACAWALASFHAKFPKRVNEFLAQGKMRDARAEKMAIRKILKSRVTSRQDREFLKSLKTKKPSEKIRRPKN
ncbi:MAG: DNA alkylation repair protein [Opitutales bacterium]|nr:DNA alkylation repair protein [Opitutales bacterium]